MTSLKGKVFRNADDIGIYGDRLFITCFPHGHGRAPNHHVNLDVVEASQKSA